MDGAIPTRFGWVWANPCVVADMELFYVITKISLGNGNIAPFWDSPWLNGRNPKDIAPLVPETSTHKKWKVKQAMHNNAWISKIEMNLNLTIPQIQQYIQLWSEFNTIQLREVVEDSIVWTLTSSGEYSSSSNYNTQFFRATKSCMSKLVWKAWDPPRIKFFAWLTT
jgi:hypothetical protein